MTSLRRRLLVGSAAATIATFIAAASALYVLARHFLVSEFDAGLKTRIQAIVSMTEFDVGANALDAEDALEIPEFRVGENPEYFEIESTDGRHLLRSLSLKNDRLDRTRPPPHGAGFVAAFVRLPDGRAGRALAYQARTHVDQRLPASAGPDIVITVAKATAQLDHLLARLRLLLLVVCGIATTTLLGLTGWIVRRGLRPLDRLAGEIGSIGAADLTERVRASGVPEELSPIVARLNELLARLEGAFEREKCFTADAAHELRTPLAGVATALEVCARQRRDAPRYERVIQDCLKVVRQMHGIIDNLLLLARADAEQIQVNHGIVHVDEVIRSAWAAFHQPSAHRGIAVELHVDDEMHAGTDVEKLSIILNNLLENAVRYVDDAGRIRIDAELAADKLRITVSNTGSRVASEDETRVFDRFWRGDASRSSRGRSCGLGLAVCRRLVSALEGTISASSTVGGWFTIRVELPVVPPAAKSTRVDSLREEAAHRV